MANSPGRVKKGMGAFRPGLWSFLRFAIFFDVDFDQIYNSLFKGQIDQF